MLRAPAADEIDHDFDAAYSASLDRERSSPVGGRITLEIVLGLTGEVVLGLGGLALAPSCHSYSVCGGQVAGLLIGGTLGAISGVYFGGNIGGGDGSFGATAAGGAAGLFVGLAGVAAASDTGSELVGVVALSMPVISATVGYESSSGRSRRGREETRISATHISATPAKEGGVLSLGGRF